MILFLLCSNTPLAANAAVQTSCMSFVYPKFQINREQLKPQNETQALVVELVYFYERALFLLELQMEKANKSTLQAARERYDEILSQIQKFEARAQQLGESQLKDAVEYLSTLGRRITNHKIIVPAENLFTELLKPFLLPYRLQNTSKYFSASEIPFVEIGGVRDRDSYCRKHPSFLLWIGERRWIVYAAGFLAIALLS